MNQPLMNPFLVLILSLIGIAVIYFVLFGQKKYNELMEK